MKSNLLPSKSLKRLLKIEVDAKAVSLAFETELKKIGKKVSLPGFRKGKAPLKALRASYGKTVIPNVVENLVNENYLLAIKEHDIHPVSSPKIDFEEIVDQQGFIFSALIEVKPDISLKKYKSFEFKREELSVEESRIQSTIDKLLDSHSENIPILEDRPAQNGDFVDIHFEGTLANGSSLPNKSANHFVFELGSQSFISGFEEGIEGMKFGEEKILNLKFPKDYYEQDISGQSVNFKITLNKIMKKVAPELTDDFVASIKDSNIKTVVKN